MASALKKRVKDLEIGSKKSRDIDPEDDPFSKNPNSSDSDSDSEENAATGREHYEVVGKSKLRKPERIQLDSKKYGGTVVSRAALNGDTNDDDSDALAPAEDSDDDPFAAPSDMKSDDEDESLDIDGAANADEDDEIDSDEAFEEGDEERFRGKGFVFRGSGVSHKTVADIISDDEVDDTDSSNAATQESEAGSSSTENSDFDMEDAGNTYSDSNDDDVDGEDDEDDEDDESGDDDEEDEDEDEITARPKLAGLPQPSGTKREHLKSLMSDTAAIATSLSQAASADAKKGDAVRKQYQTYDRFVDARMKLQKGLVSTNELSSLDVISDSDAQQAVRKAEEAALALFSTIESIRQTIQESHQDSTSAKKASPKRKRASAVSPVTTDADVLERMTDLELDLDSRRRIVLDKWSNKTRSAIQQVSGASASKLKSSSDTTNSQSNLSAVIDTYLHSTLDKLITESRLNLTTAATTTDTNNNPISSSTLPPFQDTVFYQSLLRDVITTRARLDSSNPSSLPSSSSLGANSAALLPTKLHPSGPQSALLRNKQINRKASKGRQIRYTVHEKLENFMTGTGMGTSGSGGARGSGQWSDAAVREFFGSLLGGGNVLAEDDDDDGDADADEDGREMEALKLFRS